MTEPKEGTALMSTEQEPPFPVSCSDKRCRQTGGDLNTLSRNSFTLPTNPDGAPGEGISGRLVQICKPVV